MSRRRMLRTIGTGVLGAAAVAAASIAVASRLWDRGTAAAVRRIREQTRADETVRPPFAPEALDGLPAPVGRYFRFALTSGQRVVRFARIEHEGMFLAELRGRPGAFTSVQHFASRPPAFVWDARIRLRPGVPVRVRDTYIGRQGAMLGRLAGLVPVVDQGGTPEMASGSLSRWLAEAVWLPTALLPGNGVRWDAVDDSSARATLLDGRTSVTMEVRFGAHGEITGIAADRYRDVRGKAVMTPWEVRVQGYERHAGMMIPMAGEVAWILPEGRLVYWRGRVVHAQYEFEP